MPTATPLNVVDFDAEPVAPEGSADGRAEACEVLSRADFDLLVNDNTAALLRQAAQDAETEQERAGGTWNCSVPTTQISKIPADEYAAFTKLTQQSIPRLGQGQAHQRFQRICTVSGEDRGCPPRPGPLLCLDRDPYEVLLDQYEHG